MRVYWACTLHLKKELPRERAHRPLNTIEDPWCSATSQSRYMFFIVVVAFAIQVVHNKLRIKETQKNDQ